jgi:putative ABC transport system permease protein
MIRHLLRIVWNRRRTNLLISIEIFLSFLVVATVLILGLYLADNYRQPLGYSYQDVWSVRMSMNAPERNFRGRHLPFKHAGRPARQSPLWACCAIGGGHDERPHGRSS